MALGHATGLQVLTLRLPCRRRSRYEEPTIGQQLHHLNSGTLTEDSQEG
jgi:hypothetical protein